MPNIRKGRNAKGKAKPAKPVAVPATKMQTAHPTNLLDEACRESFYPAPVYEVTRKTQRSPCKVDLSAAGFNVVLQFDKQFDDRDVKKDIKRAKAVCSDLILKCVYPEEHELQSTTVPYEETEITQIDEDADFCAKVESYRVERMARFEKSLAKFAAEPETCKPEIQEKVQANMQKFAGMRESREFVSYQQLHTAVKEYGSDVTPWYYWSQQLSKYLKLEDEWEMAKVDGTEDSWQVTVSVHQREAGSQELTYLFSIDYNADFSGLEEPKRGSRAQAISKQLRAEAGQKFLAQLAARQLIPSMEPAVIEPHLGMKRDEHTEFVKEDKVEQAYQKERHLRVYEAREALDAAMGIVKAKKITSVEMRTKREAQQERREAGAVRQKEKAKKRSKERSDKRRAQKRATESSSQEPTSRSPKKRSRGGVKEKARQALRESGQFNGRQNGGGQQNGGGAYYGGAVPQPIYGWSNQAPQPPQQQSWVPPPQGNQYQAPPSQPPRGNNNYASGHVTGAQWAKPESSVHQPSPQQSNIQKLVDMQKEQMEQMMKMHQQQLNQAQQQQF